MSGYCDYPPSNGRYCRTSAIDHKHNDGHTYCAHHLGVVKREGSPYPIKFRLAETSSLPDLIAGFYPPETKAGLTSRGNLGRPNPGNLSRVGIDTYTFSD
jgi:hypothetical protein